MKLYLKLALKEILNNRKFSFFFILNMAVGLTGFIVISAFSTSFDRYIGNNLKEILTADFMIVSSRPLKDEEINLADNVLGEDRKESLQITFYSMVKGKKQSKLSRVVAIDRKFPLYGKFHTDDKGSMDVNDKIQKEPLVLMEKDTALFLGIKKGDSVRIGNRLYRLNSFVIDSDRSLTDVEFAPKVFIGIDQLKKTDLLGYGSRARYIRFYSYPEGTDTRSIIKKLNESFEEFYKGEPQVSIVDSSSVARRIERFIGNFTGYLGLIASLALFLAGIATAYLFRGYLNMKLKEISILMSIGATRFQSCFIFTAQLLLLGILASILSLLLSWIIIPVFPVILRGLIPSELNISINSFSVSTALLMGSVGSIIFCLPVVARIYSVKPLTLLRELKNSRGIKEKLYTVFSFLPALAAFFLVSSFLLNSFSKGFFFTAGFLFVIVLFGIFGIIIFTGCRWLSDKVKSVVWRISLRNLYRNKLSSVSCFVTISMGVFLINIIPQIQSGIVTEIERPEGLKMPSFFLIDVQEEQVDEAVNFFKKEGLKLSNISPVVYGRILNVNGEGFIKRRERIRKNTGRKPRRYRRVEYMFSSRDKLAKSENIVLGKPLSAESWSWESNEPFGISIAKRFAERNDLNPGDIMEFEIQGIPLKGRIANIRKVRWNSFEPNFYILFQKGVLENAPKTYLASVAGVPAERRTALKNRLFDRFPNVSVLDVTKTIEQVLSITERLSLSIKFMAYLAILAGLVSIFSIARNEAAKHEKEINLLKILGSGFNDLRKISGFEFGFIGLFAALFASLLSIVFSYIISFYFFDRLWSFRWEYSAFIIAATTIICFLTAIWATEKTIRKKAVLLLG